MNAVRLCFFLAVTCGVADTADGLHVIVMLRRITEIMIIGMSRLTFSPNMPAV